MLDYFVHNVLLYISCYKLLVAGLRALYLSTGGPTSWLRNGCWLNESVPVCWWDQVLCDPVTWRVRELRLSSNVLTGTLPSALGMK